jgi:hypothetical protein
MNVFDFEVRWARVVGRAVVPCGVLGGAVDDLDAGALFREDCALSPAAATLGMRAALWLTWFAPLWMSFRFRTFGGLDAPAQVALLERLLKAKSYIIRMAVTLLKITFCSLLLGDKRVLQAWNAYDLDRLPAPAGEKQIEEHAP